jgi:hypothetical protein
LNYLPWLLVLMVLVVLMAGSGRRRVQAGEMMLVTIGGLLILAILFGFVLFRD